MSDRALTFTAAVRVVVRVHNRASDGRLNAEMTGFAGFADAYNFVLYVADLPYGCLALNGNESHFAGRHLQSRVRALFCHNLRGNSCRSRNLRAASGLHFDCVDYRTYGDFRKRKAVARLDVRARTRKHLVAYRKSDGRENVSLFAVCISEKRDVRRPVGVVLNGLNRCGYTVLITLEIDYSVFGFVAAADMTNGYFALIVSAARFALIVKSASFGFVA